MIDYDNNLAQCAYSYTLESDSVGEGILAMAYTTLVGILSDVINIHKYNEKTLKIFKNRQNFSV